MIATKKEVRALRGQLRDLELSYLRLSESVSRLSSIVGAAQDNYWLLLDHLELRKVTEPQRTFLAKKGGPERD